MHDNAIELFGSNDLDRWFCHGAPQVLVPWPRAGGLKSPDAPRNVFTYEMARSPIYPTEVDPRELWASQPWVLREHVDHYRTGRWERTGITSADADKEANRYPLIMIDHLGRKVIRSGHHRSMAALIEGRPLIARMFPGEPDDAIAITPAVLYGATSSIPHNVCTTEAEAVTAVWDGGRALCADKDVAIAAVLSTAPNFPIARLPLEPEERAEWSQRSAATAVGWKRTEQVDVTGAYRLCTTCGGVKADPCPFTGRMDRCSCEPCLEEQRHNDYEHNQSCTLCQACGLQVARGHSRYLFVVCDGCRVRAKEFNKRLGWVAIPQGIHSLVNGGPTLDVTVNASELLVQAWGDQLTAMFGTVRAFRKWGREMVLDRLRGFDIPTGTTVAFDHYLYLCDRAGIDADDGWNR